LLVLERPAEMIVSVSQAVMVSVTELGLGTVVLPAGFATPGPGIDLLSERESGA
jgi:hypothetical protein